MRRTKILYLQHASSLGGSAMSLLYTLKGLDVRKYDPIVRVPPGAPAVELLYRRAGMAVLPWDGIGTYEHTTACWASPLRPLYSTNFFRGVMHWKRSKERTRDLVAHVKPDLVHLNSVVLAPSAAALAEIGMPFVWHVRESPVEGNFGFRKKIITDLLSQKAAEVIFISKADRKAWVNDRCGVVVSNFVNLEQFASRPRSSALETELGLSPKDRVLLYVGGGSEIKGLDVLLDALPIVRRKIPNLVCLMPGLVTAGVQKWTARVARKVLPLIGSGTYWQRMQRKIKDYDLDGIIRPFGFTTELEKFYAAADLLVFPATRPHFARPVIEAAATGRPAIASRLSGIEDTLVEGVTGLLFDSGNAVELAEKVIQLLEDPQARAMMGKAGRELAVEEFSAESNVRRIEAVYDRVLERAAVR